MTTPSPLCHSGPYTSVCHSNTAPPRGGRLQHSRLLDTRSAPTAEQVPQTSLRSSSVPPKTLNCSNKLTVQCAHFGKMTTTFSSYDVYLKSKQGGQNWQLKKERTQTGVSNVDWKDYIIIINKSYYLTLNYLVAEKDQSSSYDFFLS